ncbi:MAG: TonB-dependent receptor, partial [Verrucomicrobiota bacterium]
MTYSHKPSYLHRFGIFRKLTKLALASLAVLLAASANAEDPVVFDIPAQPLADALTVYGKLTDTQISVATRLTKGLTSATLVGKMSKVSALETLLEGTGLAYEVDRDGSVTIVREKPNSEVNSGLSGSVIQLDSITVKGQKIERSLLDTKESVAVVTGEMAQERTLLSIADAALQVPNVSGGDRNGTDVTIRGIRGGVGTAAAVGGSGDVSIALYDNVPFSGIARGFIPDNLWDVEQVEYLRGPQSTNVGRSAMAGALVIRSAEPDLNGFDAAARVEYGNFNTYAAEGMVNVPLSDSTAVRFTAERSDTDGFISNRTIEDETGPASFNVRGRLLFEPNERFRALASVQYLDEESGANSFVFAEGEDSRSFVASNNDPLSFAYQGVIGSLELGYELANGWELLSITSFLDGDYDRLTDTDRTAANLGTLDQTVGEKTITQEFRFLYGSERLRGAIGGFYFDFDSDEDRVSTIVADHPTLAAQGVPGLLLPFYANPTNALSRSEIQGGATNAAFFTQWEYDLTENLRLSAGFRYDSESIDQDLLQTGGVDPGTPLPDPVMAGQIAESQQPGTGALVQGGITQVNGLLGSLLPNFNEAFDTDYEAFLPEFGMTYAVTPGTDVSFFYKRGYRAGGAQVLLDGINTYDPEYLDNFELALRSTLLEGSFVFNANAYFGNWTDQQLDVPINGDPNNIGTINAGKSRIWGLELQGDYALSERANVFFGLGYAHTEFLEACLIGSTYDGLPDCAIDGVPGKNLAGNSFPFAPRLTASIGARREFAENWFVQANATYKDSQFSDLENDPRFESDAYALLNASLGLISLEAMDNGADFLTGIWGLFPLSWLLMLAFLVHFVLGLWSVYERPTLKTNAQDMVQLVTALLVVPLMATHVLGIYLSENFGFHLSYAGVIRIMWIEQPVIGLLQVIVVTVVWIHGCAGLLIWMRSIEKARNIILWVYPIAIAVPVLSLLGFSEAGRHVIELGDAMPDVAADADRPPAPSYAPEEMMAIFTYIKSATNWTIWVSLGLAALTLLARTFRIRFAPQQEFTVTRNQKTLQPARSGLSVFDTFREQNEAHAGLCQGRGRCGTCAVRIVT